MEPLAPATPQERIEFGGRLYQQLCAACHQREGQGVAGVFPPLAASDWLNANKEGSIRAILHGLSGPITVNGVDYNSLMPAMQLSDDEVASVLNYVYSSWGNAGLQVQPSEVAAQR